MRTLFVSLLIGYFLCASSNGQDPADSARYFYQEYLQSKLAGDFERSEVLLIRILEGEYKLPAYNRALAHNALGFVLYETGRLKEAYQQYQIAG